MTKLQLKSKYKLTLPKAIAEELGVAPGDDLLIEIRNGELHLIPAETVPRDEAYLFTPWWRKAITEAEQEIADGLVKRADSAEEMFRQIRGK